MKYDLKPLNITVALTSCGRLDLLEKTLEGFHKHYIPARFIVIEDKADERVVKLCAEKFPHIEVVLNIPQLGQMRSIDKLYALITTPYILHLEDDREPSAATDIQACIDYINENPRVVGVNLNNLVDVPQKYIDKMVVESHNGAEFYFVPKDTHPEWFGYSFNPSVIARKTWLEHGLFADYKTEENLSLKMKGLNQTFAYTKPGFFQHIGYQQHVQDPFQPPRNRSFWGRQKRSVEKRWNRLKRALGLS